MCCGRADQPAASCGLQRCASRLANTHGRPESACRWRRHAARVMTTDASSMADGRVLHCVCVRIRNAPVCHCASLAKFARHHAVGRLDLDGRLTHRAPVGGERGAAALSVALHHGAPRVIVGAGIQVFEQRVQRCVACTHDTCPPVSTKRASAQACFAPSSFDAFSSASTSFSSVLQSRGVRLAGAALADAAAAAEASAATAAGAGADAASRGGGGETPMGGPPAASDSSASHLRSQRARSALGTGDAGMGAAAAAAASSAGGSNPASKAAAARKWRLASRKRRAAKAATPARDCAAASRGASCAACSAAASSSETRDGAPDALAPSMPAMAKRGEWRALTSTVYGGTGRRRETGGPVRQFAALRSRVRAGHRATMQHAAQGCARRPAGRAACRAGPAPRRAPAATVPSPRRAAPAPAAETCGACTLCASRRRCSGPPALVFGIPLSVSFIPRWRPICHAQALAAPAARALVAPCRVARAAPAPQALTRLVALRAAVGYGALLPSLPLRGRRDMRCAAKNAPAKMFYWKDGELVTVSEDDMPLEARLACVSDGHAVRRPATPLRTRRTHATALVMQLLCRADARRVTPQADSRVDTHRTSVLGRRPARRRWALRCGTWCRTRSPCP